MSDIDSKPINSNKAEQSQTFKCSLDDLNSCKRRKEILNGKKSVEVHGENFYVKIKENRSLIESTFVINND